MNIGYTFTDKTLLQQALTHSSHSEQNYERLEFLGDRILGAVIGSWLYTAYPEASEGELSRRHMALVRESCLVQVAKAWNIGHSIRLGAGEHLKDSILADCVEAILGAIWEEDGLPAATQVIAMSWAPYIDAPDEKDPKTHLQEVLQASSHPLPVYTVVSESGPDHDKSFVVEVSTPLGTATGQGRSKQTASAAAAAQLIKNLNL
ncbi:MAG: ribonuclease III [Pseudomonas fluorescens]|nr:MAG: ribonuclease III [Pseudomonas fluorescens]